MAVTHPVNVLNHIPLGRRPQAHTSQALPVLTNFASCVLLRALGAQDMQLKTTSLEESKTKIVVENL